MKRWFLVLLPVFAWAQSPTTIPQLYAQHPAAPLTGTEILLGAQGSEPAVGILASQILTYVGNAAFSPGCALGGTINSQTVILNAGPTCILGQLPLASVNLTAAAATALTNVGPVPQWIHVGSSVAYTAFSTTATSNSLLLFNLPASGVISGVKIKQSVAFTGGAISAYTISVGNVGSPSVYASPFNVFQAPGATTYALATGLGGESATAATPIYITATSTGANLSAATAGAVDVWVLVSVVL